MKTVQITLDKETLRQVDRVGNALGLTRSEIVRHALSEWLQRHATNGFEQDWIDALKKEPDKAGRADDWLEIQAWSKK